MMADCKSAETPSGTEETYPTGRKLIKFKIDEWLKSEERPDLALERLAEVAETDRPWPLGDVDARIDSHGARVRELRRGPSPSISSLKKFGILVCPDFA